MKSKLLKDSFKEIINTRKRFISILLIVLLGVGFFSGVKATSPDMRSILDRYFDDYNVMDLEILSTMGLTEKDLVELQKIDGIEKIVPTFSTDAILETSEKDYVVKVHSYEDDINQLNILEGDLPVADDECVVEEGFLINSKYKIGDIINLQVDDMKNTDGDNVQLLKNKNLKIVGKVESPLYISRTRPTSKLGSGQIDYYIYTNNKNFNKEIGMYTGMYITVENTKEYRSGSKKYWDLVHNVEDKIDAIVDQREQARYQEIVDKLTAKVTDAENELADQTKKAQDEISNGENEIAQAKDKIESGKSELEVNKKKVYAQINDGKLKLEQAKKEYEHKSAAFYDGKEQVEKGLVEPKKQLEGLNNIISYYDKNITNSDDVDLISLSDKLITFENILKENNLENVELSNQIDTLVQTCKVCPDEQKVYVINQIKNVVPQGCIAAKEKLDSSITSAENELNKNEKLLIDGKKEIESQESKLASSELKANKEFKKAEAEISDGEAKISENEAKIKDAKNTLEEKTAEANDKIKDAKEKIKDVKKPEWYVLNREKNAGYLGYSQDADRIENISKVFPIVFFVVAALVSLNAMTRMVEEQRGQIGILKALGYGKMQISRKYIMYAFLATVLGSMIGAVIGFSIIPHIITSIYAMMYTIPLYPLEFQWKYAYIGFGLAALCTVGATIVTCIRDLSESPATLMRPKAPKAGKRVLLENIPFIWKHLKFTQKVTIRNLFRYKKRFLMTIIGIAGCSALIIAGFGIRDSVSNMIPGQYGKIFKYDFQVEFKSGLDDSVINEHKEKLLQDDNVKDVELLNVNSGTVIGQEKEADVSIVVPEDIEQFKNYVELENRKDDKEKYELDNDNVIITEKLSKLLNIKVGDIIKVKDSNDEIFEMKVGAITEHYLRHYIYMSKDLYRKIYGYDMKVNTVWGILKDNVSDVQEKDLGEKILSNKDVYSSVSFLSTTKSLFSDVMESMATVSLVLVTAAGLLAFVVLYNLSNLNISERIRELATIKVLGFYDREVYKYVTREVVILTVIGIALGLIAGRFLVLFILHTCEMDMLIFYTTISLRSYTISVVLTSVFALIVNWITYFSLKKVNMIESLKSVE